MFTDACRQFDLKRWNGAYRLMHKAALHNFIAAQSNLGVFFFDGIGVKKDRNLGMFWSKSAVRGGDSTAAVNIALEYLSTGRRERARYWLEKAISLGNNNALFHLGKLMLEGRTAENKRKGYKLIKKSVLARCISNDQVVEARALMVGKKGLRE